MGAEGEEALVRAGGCEEITRGAKAVMLTAVPKALRAQVLGVVDDM